MIVVVLLLSKSSRRFWDCKTGIKAKQSLNEESCERDR
jgi:hypothetical protein